MSDVVTDIFRRRFGDPAPSPPRIALDAKRPKKNGELVLRPVRPNVGIAIAYRERVMRIVDEMRRSIDWFVLAAYRANEPKIAMDAVPAAELQKTINDLARRWRTRFDEAGPELAEYFAKATSQRSDAALAAILRKAGMTVKFKMTPAMRDILRATVEQNVGLIKSIPEQYLTQVQGSVMRSVQAGRDLGSLAKELQQHYGVTKRRAALIARSQNNLATASMQRARQTELGIEEAVWLHSHGGKEARPTHLANNGKRYKVSEGFFDPDPKVRRFIWPGELINCRCTQRSVVKGFS